MAQEDVVPGKTAVRLPFSCSNLVVGNSSKFVFEKSTLEDQFHRDTSTPMLHSFKVEGAFIVDLSPHPFNSSSNLELSKNLSANNITLLLFSMEKFTFLSNSIDERC